MLNRRLIRVKVYQAFYAYMQNEEESLKAASSYLSNSLNGVYDTFFSFITFPLELAHFVEVERNPKENKFIVSDEQVRQYEALSLTELREKLMSHGQIKQMLERPKIRWADQKDMIQLGYKKFKSAEFFKKFLESNIHSEIDQVNYLREAYRFMANGFEEFDSFMEEHEMHWEDEKFPVLKSAEMFVDSLSATVDDIVIPSLAKNLEEDMEFAQDLLKKSVRNQEEYTEMISKFTKGWEAERIAKSDMLLMVMALVEYTEFPYIPVKVTLNEYLEIAKKYSTPQSSKFLNGVLDKLLHHLKEEGKIVKKGRGLVQ